MGRAGQSNGAGAMWKRKGFQQSRSLHKNGFWAGGKQTNKQKPALTVLKQLISASWKGMVGICLGVQVWLLFSRVLFQLGLLSLEGKGKRGQASEAS